MIEKIFIKNYENTQDPEVRTAYGNVAGKVGIVTNFLLGAVKLFLGIVSHSVSIMADAVNNIADMATSILTIIGFKLASRKPDREHPYGYARYEYVCGFLIAVFMLEMGILFAKESIGKILHPEELVINTMTYIILIVALLGKFFLMRVYRSFSKKIDSNALEATATDTRNDIISSSAIFISMVVMGIFKINIDGYLGLGVSVFVIISSLMTLKEELEPIIGIKPTKEQVEEIAGRLMTYEVVHGIHDLQIHNYGVNNDIATVHVEVDSKMDILVAHDMIDNIENDFRKQLGIMLTIHMDPVAVGDSNTDVLRNEVSKAMSEFDSSLTIHDFRIVEGPSHTNVVFDCVVPQDKSYTAEDISSMLTEHFKGCGKTYYFVIEIDRPYC